MLISAIVVGASVSVVLVRMLVSWRRRNSTVTDAGELSERWVAEHRFGPMSRL